MKLFGEKKLSDCKVVILATNGFEESELLKPMQALQEAGAEVLVVSPESGQIKGWSHKDWGKSVPVDLILADAQAEEFDALMLPGGVMNPDTLRMNKEAVKFVNHFVTTQKPIAAICHGPQVLLETDCLEGRTLTSWPSLKTDISNAGGNWVDLEVVTDNGLVTSRKPEDIPAFNRKMIEEFAEGRHNRMVAQNQKGRETRPQPF